MVNIYIQGQLVDQFDDENVEVVSRVLSITDITKVQGDYSKDFTLPASKTNNKIFKHWYNSSILGGFDARTKVDGRIDIDGVPFKTGKFKLREAKVEDGIITSYTVNFFGNVTNLKDILGESKLVDLDFDFADFNYSEGSVRTKFKTNSSAPYPEVVFTPMSKRRFYYQSGTNSEFDSYKDAINWQKETNNYNIAYETNTGGGTPRNKAIGMSWTDLEASLRADIVIDAIEGTFPELSFSRDFFDTTEFKRLYMLMSSSEGRPQLNEENTKVNYLTRLVYDGYNLVNSDTTLTSLSSNVTSSILSTGDALLTNIAFLPVNEGSADVRVRLYVDLGDGLGYSLKQEVSGTCSRGDGISTNQEFKTPMTETRQLLAGNKIIKHYYEVDTLNGMDVNCKLFNSIATSSGTPAYYTYGIESFTGTFGVAKNMPDLKVIDFLKGLFQMFKLVVVPQEDGTLYVNTINSYYSQGTRYDVSKYVDRSSINVKRGELISSVDFKFKESETVMNYGFVQANGRGYGDLRIDFTKGYSGEKFDGEAVEMESPFETLVFERISDAGELTNIQCGHLVDKEIKPLNVGPILHYISSQDLNSNPIGWIDTNNNFTEFDDEVHIPCHTLSIDDPYSSILFNDEFSTWNAVRIEPTLYREYYQGYIDGVRDIRSRITSYTAKLPVIISANLNMNDVLSVDGIQYRLNSYKYNMLSGLSKLELVNGLDTTLAPFNGAPSTLYVPRLGDEYQFNLPNADDYTISRVDLGDGTSWITNSTSYEATRGVQRHNSYIIDVAQYTGSAYGYRRARVDFTLNGTTTSMIVLQRKRDIVE